MDDFLMYETAEEYYDFYCNDEELLFSNTTKKKNPQYNYDNFNNYYFNSNDDSDIDMYRY